MSNSNSSSGRLGTTFSVDQFLTDFGYLGQAPPGGWTPEIKQTAIAKAKGFYGLDPSGTLSSAEEKVFALTPRCGHKDVLHARGFIPKWGIAHLTYCIVDYPVGLGLTKADVTAIVGRCYQSAAAACGLTFEQVPPERQSTANIVMRAARGRRAGFDGPSGTLAYAYPPQTGDYRGQLDLFWDLDEPWGDDRWQNAILFDAVTEHELGHIFGMDHDQTPQQLMNAFYTRAIRTYQDNDKKRLRGLYGSATGPVLPPIVPPTVPGVPGLPPVGGPLTSLEILLRVNGSQVIGPQAIDLTRVKTATLAELAAAFTAGQS